MPMGGPSIYDSLCLAKQEFSVKPVLHYAFLACVLEGNARDFTLGNLQAYFLSEMMMEY